MRWSVSERAESRISKTRKCHCQKEDREIPDLSPVRPGHRHRDVSLYGTFSESMCVVVRASFERCREIIHAHIARSGEKKGRQTENAGNESLPLPLFARLLLLDAFRIFSLSLSLSLHAHTLWRRTQTTVFANAAVQYIHP